MIVSPGYWAGVFHDLQDHFLLGNFYSSTGIGWIGMGKNLRGGRLVRRILWRKKQRSEEVLMVMWFVRQEQIQGTFRKKSTCKLSPRLGWTEVRVGFEMKSGWQSIVASMNSKNWSQKGEQFQGKTSASEMPEGDSRTWNTALQKTDWGPIVKVGNHLI